MLIAQITDTHVTVPGALLERNYDTAANLARAVRHLNALDPLPDVVLLTGDSVDEGSWEEYVRLRHILAPLKPPLYVIPGNHDHRETMRDAFADHAYLPRAGFLHYTVEGWPVRLIGLDTQVPGEARGELCEARIAWLAARLAEAPEQPTVVFMHHPPFATGFMLMDSIGLRGADRLAQVISANRQVRQLLSGHIHRPIAAVFAGTLATVSPSTAQQAALELQREPRLSVVMDPPAVTILFWDDATGTLAHHLSYIGERPRHVLYDGTRWLLDTPAPPGFRDG